MKAGTTYLFDLLGKHPQILLTLRGYGFKETGCYFAPFSDKSSGERMNCFPFTEPQDVSQIASTHL